MHQFLLFVFLASVFFQIYYSKKYFSYVVNPILVFNLIHFLNNWCVFYFNGLGFDIQHYVPYQIHSEVKLSIAIINLVNCWAFFLFFFVFGWRRVRYNENNSNGYEYFKSIYFLFVVLTIVETVMTGKASRIYGVNQALSSAEAFSPIATLLSLRVILGSVTLILNKRNSKLCYWILIIELVFSLMLGGRKGFIIVLLSYILPRMTSLNFRKSIIYSIAFILFAFLISFLGAYRAFSSFDISFYNKVEFALELAFFQEDAFFFKPLTVASSESVQAWMYQLYMDGGIELTHGLSYIQAFLNTFILRPLQGGLVDFQAAYYFKNVAYPYERNMGYDFSFTAESILNFGPYFSWITFSILGLVIGWVHSKANNIFYYILYWLSWSVLIVTFRSDMTNTLRYISVFVFVVLIVRFLRDISGGKKFE